MGAKAGSHWLRHRVVVQLILAHLKLSWPTAELTICKVICSLFCIIKHFLNILNLRKAIWGKVHGQTQEQSPELLPFNRWSNQWFTLLPLFLLQSLIWLNTLSSPQHVFPLQFFISNIHFGFGLFSNVMWMETRCLFWTQQNKRRVTEPILPQSKLVLTTTPTVGDRLCGTGPVLI